APADRAAGAHARPGARDLPAAGRGLGGPASGGKREPEGRSAAGRRADRERPAVRLRDRAGDEEAEAGSRLALASRVQPSELLEDHLLILDRDTGAAVADVHVDEAVLGGGRE